MSEYIYTENISLFISTFQLYEYLLLHLTMWTDIFIFTTTSKIALHERTLSFPRFNIPRSRRKFIRRTVNHLRWAIWLRTVTSDRTVYNNSSLSFRTRVGTISLRQKNYREVINLLFVSPILFKSSFQRKRFNLSGFPSELVRRATDCNAVGSRRGSKLRSISQSDAGSSISTRRKLFHLLTWRVAELREFYQSFQERVREKICNWSRERERERKRQRMSNVDRRIVEIREDYHFEHRERRTKPLRVCIVDCFVSMGCNDSVITREHR